MPDPDLTDLLARLDRLLNQVHLVEAELTALREAVAGQVHLPDEFTAETGPFGYSKGPLSQKIRQPLAADLSDGSLIDTTSASARFGYPRDTIASWCRQGDGKKVGGRWMVDPEKMRQRINNGRG